ncbi:MAG: OsmC family peroxiredoxin [Halobacteriovoraceae bacterium]|nr:OsmC family peroxiredoxin [Halobacteriovoraceae bacterium]|tara:strand:- start:282129 stop:282581 length:453 start_codon:yes stop_codon:yes gene_type:complete
MTIQKKGSARWSGGIKDGKGFVSTETSALSAQPYGFNARFENGAGTNPEELIGAAHSSCFAMALSGNLEKEGYTAKDLDAVATVSLEKIGEGYEVTKIDLFLKAEVEGIDDKTFQDVVEKTKDTCPISKLLNAEITLDWQLTGSSTEARA